MKPFRFTAPDASERDMHEAVARALKAVIRKPAFWCAYPAGVVQLSPAQAAAYSRFGLKTGMPDFQIWYNGIWLIELKTGKGQLTRTRIVKTRQGALREIVGQVERIEELRATGTVRDIAICRSVAQVIDQCERWQIPLKGRIAA